MTISVHIPSREALAMTKLVLSLTLTGAACLLSSMPALAQSRVFIAAQGSDANPCTFAAPCRTFQHAHDTVQAGGEIDVLDPAGYGTISINKAISIQGHGFAGIAAPNNANAITINAGPGDRINLRGLLIDGAGSGADGILFQAGWSLNLQDCLVRNFLLGNGIIFAPGASGNLFVSDTVISDNAFDGIGVTPVASGTVTVALDRVEIDNNNQYGLRASAVGASTASINVSLRDSVVAYNGTGVYALSGFSNPQPIVITVANSGIDNNNVALNAQGATAAIYATRSTITGNTTSLQVTSSGQIWSYGDNAIHGNGSNIYPATTPLH
jgi:hypothetical protein